MNAMDKALANRLTDEILAAELNLESLSILCARDEWRGLWRQIGMVMSSYVYMTTAIVRQFPDLDADRDDAKRRPLLADHVGAEDEKREFHEHVAEASALYQAVADAVAQGPSP